MYSSFSVSKINLSLIINSMQLSVQKYYIQACTLFFVISTHFKSSLWFNSSLKYYLTPLNQPQYINLDQQRCMG